MLFVRRPLLVAATFFALGLIVGLGTTGLGSAMQHVKVAELYKADLVTSDG